MTQMLLALPVSVEQVAAAIRQMRPAERRRLFDLVPELRDEISPIQPRALEQARQSVEQLRNEISLRLGPLTGLAPDTLFIGSLTLNDYLQLPDDERAKMWESPEAWDEAGEREVRPDALPAR